MEDWWGGTGSLYTPRSTPGPCGMDQMHVTAAPSGAVPRVQQHARRERGREGKGTNRGGQWDLESRLLACADRVNSHLTQSRPSVWLWAQKHTPAVTSPSCKVRNFALRPPVPSEQKRKFRVLLPVSYQKVYLYLGGGVERSKTSERGGGGGQGLSDEAGQSLAGRQPLHPP